MSFQSEPNKDYYTAGPGDASYAPRAGFMRSFDISYEAQARASSRNAITYYLANEDADQARKAKAAGVVYNTLETDPEAATAMNDGPSVLGLVPGFGRGIYDRYDRLATAIVDGNADEIGSYLDKSDKQIEEMAKAHPNLGLKTRRQMFEGIKAKAQQAERDYANTETTFGGSVGGFVGGMLAGMDPRTDPLNFVTAPVGFGAKTVLGRMGMQAAGQGVTEVINQATGVQDNRRRLGLDYGAGNAAGAVGAAVLGGAAFQGAGEVLGAGIRRAGRRAGLRWFQDSPDAKAPPEPTPAAAPVDPTVAPAPVARMPNAVESIAARTELGKTRLGASRVADDVGYVTSQLDRWDSPKPYEWVPPDPRTFMDTALPEKVAFDNAPKYKVAEQSADDLARQIDPDTFRVYDKYAAQRDGARAELEANTAARDMQAREAVAPLQEQIDALQAKSEGATKRNVKKYADRIGALQEQIDIEYANARQGDSPDMTTSRQKVQEADQRMRDMAEPVSRAYARARGQWALDETHRAAIGKMVEAGSPTAKPWLPEYGDLPKAGKTADQPEPVAPRSMRDDIPVLATRPDVEVPEGGDVTDALNKIYSESLKDIDDGLKAFEQLTKPALASGKMNVDIDGKTVELDLDKTKLIALDSNGAEREMTARQYLEDLDHDFEAQKAVIACSTGSPSPTA